MLTAIHAGRPSEASLALDHQSVRLSSATRCPRPSGRAAAYRTQRADYAIRPAHTPYEQGVAVCASAVDAPAALLHRTLDGFSVRGMKNPTATIKEILGSREAASISDWVPGTHENDRLASSRLAQGGTAP